MNNIMTHQRTNLTTDSMNSLLTIKMSGMTFKNYDPVGAICRWSPVNLPDTRKRRLNVKPYGPRPRKTARQEVQGETQTAPGADKSESENSETSDSDSESESDFEIPSSSGQGGGGLAKLIDAEEDSDSDSSESDF